MLNKWVVFVLCLMGLIGLVISYNRHQEHELKVATTPVKTIENVLQQIPASHASVQDKEIQKSNLQTDKFTSEQQGILTEIETRIFSDDAYVELASMGINVGLCRDEVDISNLFFGVGGIYQQQKELVESLKIACEGYRNNYSNTLSMSEKNLQKLFQPTSQLGRLIKTQSNQGLTQVERIENAKLTILYSLKEKNSSLMMLSAFMLKFGGGNHEPFKIELKSNDVLYIGQMSQLALSLLSCEYQNGQSCRSTSMTMVMICAQDPDSCGLDYPTWYENNTMPGMKRDVEKLMAYFQQFSF